MAYLDAREKCGHGLDVSSPTQFSPSVPDGNAYPAPGELNIKERRSWKSWQLVVAMVAAALVGMALNYRSVGATQSSNQGAYQLPPAAGSGASTTTTGAVATTSTTDSGSSTTTTSTSDSGSTTTTMLSTTATSAAVAPAGLLVGPTQSHGNWTSPAFGITTPGWNIGWAFQCTPAPTAGPSFEIFVTPVGTSPSGAPAISETGASAQSVTSETSTGQQVLVVEAPANCEWAVKVTGS
jgi:hypothetical protein